MTKLSLNWQRLQKTVAPKSKVKKKRTESAIVPKETKEQVREKVISTEVSKLAHALWSNEHSIELEKITSSSSTHINPNIPKKTLPGKFLAIDCEFVGVGPEGTESALARVSIVNYYGHTIYDKFVKPKEKVTDWRTWVSGVTPKHMKEAVTFKEAQEQTADLLKDRILVGHAVHHDLESLFLSHPKSMTRDTSNFKPFRAISNGKTPGLKKLTKHFLKLEIQDGQHSSVEDARATMLLFRLHKKEFEKAFKKHLS